MTNANSFPCDRCGLCCCNLKLNLAYARLDRGDGLCMHLDQNKRDCRIYETRPNLCRVEASYQHFAHILSLADYYAINIRACEILKTTDNFQAG